MILLNHIRASHFRIRKIRPRLNASVALETLAHMRALRNNNWTSKCVRTAQQRARQVLPFVTLWLTMWG